jgi:hypothetical protein
VKNYLIVIFVFILSGCTLTPIKQVATIQSETPLPAVSNYLISQAQKCWVRKATWTKDEIRLETMQNQGSYFIIVGRDNSDIPFKPFMEIKLSTSITGTEILVKEGSYAYNTYLNLADDVKRWLHSDSSCSELSA